ncbi:MAG: GGDEF domain-containing protein [Velocimicrobium sp.]
MNKQQKELNSPSFKKNQWIINAILFSIHIILLVLFLKLKIDWMIAINIGSVLLYLINFKLIERDRYIIVFRLTYFEIVIHLVLATISLGVSSGFIMFGTVLPAYFYFTMRGILSGTDDSNVENVFVYQLFATGAMVASTAWSLKYGSIYVITKQMQLIFHSMSIVLIMFVFSYVMGYFLRQVQYFEFHLIAQKNKFIKMSKYDALTGLHNRHSIQDYLENIRLNKIDFSVILCDIDDFKKINDTYGHVCGDQVLVYISNVLKSLIRENGIISRWGGEEILIVLPNYSLEQAKEIAEQLRFEIEQEIFSYEEEKISLTMTLGVLRASKNQTLTEIIKQVDLYLYKGKEAGKNCVIVE